MRHAVLAVVALVGVVLLTIGPAALAPLAGAVLALCSIAAAISRTPNRY